MRISGGNVLNCHENDVTAKHLSEISFDFVVKYDPDMQVFL